MRDVAPTTRSCAREASPSQIYATEELQRFAREITGAALPIVTDEAPLPPYAILLGETRHTAAVLGGPADLAALGTDGFTLRTAGPHLAILGSKVRGTLYGVYELLERYGGCRWYASFHSVIPSRPTWRIPALNTTQIPAFAVREPWWYDLFGGEFAARSRVNGSRMELDDRQGGNVRFGRGLFCHTFYRLLPPSEFFAAHPEYFSEINGRRKAEGAQLCLTNDDVARLVSERVLARIRQDPGGKLYSVSQNDWYGYCTCARCRALDQAEGSHAGSLIHFVNRVAEAVEKEFPDVWIETLAYQYGRTPPKQVHPRHNVVPRLSTIECDFSKPLDGSPDAQNRRLTQDIKGWSAITDKLFVWDYTTNFHHYLGPFPDFGAIQANVRFFRDNHAVGLLEQGAYEGRHAEFAELRAWILAKLLWNPDQPIEPLYDDFFQGYYAAAAEPIRTYFEELQALVRPPEVHLGIFDSMRAPWLTDSFLERAAKLWGEAERRAKDDPKLSCRVRMSGMTVLYARLQRMPEPAPRYALRGDAMALDGAPEYLAVGRQLLDRVEEGKARIREYASYNQDCMAALRGRVQGFPLVRAAASGLTLGAVPGLGGSVVKLAPEGAANVLAPAMAGLQVVDRHWRLGQPDLDPFVLDSGEASSVAMHRVVPDEYRIERRVQLGTEGLRFEQRYVSSQLEAQTLSPAVRLAMELGQADAVILRAGNNSHRLAIPRDQTRASLSLPGAALPEGEWTLAAEAGGPAMRLMVSAASPQRAILSADVKQGALLFLVLAAPRELPAGGTLSLAVRSQPASEAVPAGAGRLAAHRADRVVIEDWEMSLSRLGEWCEVVSDADSGNGFAIKLLGNNFEWNAIWRVQAERLEPGARYQARVRMKVVKAGRPGTALWAGIYDNARKKEVAGLALRADQVGEGYHWVDLGTWMPEPGQYLWVGPGRYAPGARSAVEAVYVDRYELTRV